ncbi:restriction endonuclease subunit S [Accumulibacter sp.]|uniref:restriction endonuclease subunit S n=1 Tax=Accumulibacter sp. TaxID=2053492 RepID=UPI0025EA4AEC|nr:restriction endonuclease subunit S [Accumulibacter sp.]
MAAIIDYRGKSPEKATFGVPLVTAKIVKGGRIEKPEEFIAEADFEDWMRRGMPKPGDIVMTTEAPLGEVAQLDGRKVALAQRVITLRGKPDVLDNTFLKFLLQSSPVQEELRSRGTGTTVVGIRQSELRKVSLALPSLAEQKAIAAVLGALDDKIELNQRMNATLEALARALFDNWTQLHANAIEEHIVQELIDNKVLLIGDGYRAKNSEFATDGLPFVRAGNLKVDGLDLAGAEVLSAHSTAAAGHKVGKVDDVAFTSKGTIGRITRVSPKTGPFVYSPQVCFWRSVARDTLNPNVLYRWMRSADFTRQVTAVSAQTDMAPYVSLQDQKKMVIQLPPPSAQSEIAEQLEPIDARIAANAEQSRTLATLRDTLLPKLLSGELNLPAALLAAQAGVAAAASNI